MPSLIAKVCGYPGCTKVSSESYCLAHAKARSKARTRAWASGHARQRGYTYEWDKYRLVFLTKHPLCVVCELRGRTTEAKVVDHIIPHKGDRGLFWDATNHQALCRPCHDSKTGRGL